MIRKLNMIKNIYLNFMIESDIATFEVVDYLINP